MKTATARCLLYVLLGSAFVIVSTVGHAASHALINATRSSESNIFVTQCIEGEYGHLSKVFSGEKDTPSESRVWRGYGFRNAVGIELMRFIQFSVAHTFVNMRSKANALENIRGSRLGGEAKLVFAAPIGNLEAGIGFSGGHYDYQRQLDNAEFLASGVQYGLGVNYFMTPKVSVFTHGKITRENLVRGGGSTAIESMGTNMSSLGIGFNLWL